jgi:hypothetical protein
MRHASKYREPQRKDSLAVLAPRSGHRIPFPCRNRLYSLKFKNKLNLPRVKTYGTRKD